MSHREKSNEREEKQGKSTMPQNDASNKPAQTHVTLETNKFSALFDLVRMNRIDEGLARRMCLMTNKVKVE